MSNPRSTMDDLISALRRGQRIRYRSPAVAGKECEIVATGGTAEVLHVSCGPRGVVPWSPGCNTFWASEPALRDMYLNGLFDEGASPCIIA